MENFSCIYFVELSDQQKTCGRGIFYKKITKETRYDLREHNIKMIVIPNETECSEESQTKTSLEWLINLVA